MQKGSLIRSSRRRGPDVWECRWRESCSGQTRKHRRIVIGTLNTLKDESAAMKAISALRRDININDRRMKTKTVETRGTYRAFSPERTRRRQRMEDLINEGHIRGLPEKVDRAEVGSDQS
jgi:hypothetical protein